MALFLFLCFDHDGLLGSVVSPVALLFKEAVL